jgi:hypothetical protein
MLYSEFENNLPYQVLLETTAQEAFNHGLFRPSNKLDHLSLSPTLDRVWHFRARVEHTQVEPLMNLHSPRKYYTRQNALAFFAWGKKFYTLLPIRVFRAPLHLA